MPFLIRAPVAFVIVLSVVLIHQRFLSITLLTSAFYCTTTLIYRRTSLLATSSVNLQEGTYSIGGKNETVVRGKQKYPIGSVVSRLKHAAMQAAAAAASEQLQENIQMKNTFFSNRSSLSSKVELINNQERKIGTLRDLTNEIDLQLRRARALPWGQYQTHMLYHSQPLRFQKQPHHVSVLPRDSITAIITHNIQNQVSARGLQFYTSTITHQPNINMTTTTSQPMASAILTTTLRHVAIVLTKRSIMKDGKHMLSVECAGRIQRLVHAMKFDNYYPSVIVFVGPQHSNAQCSTCRDTLQNPTFTEAFGDNLPSSDADLGHEYFIYLLNATRNQSLQIDLSNVTFHLERSSLSLQAFENISSFIQHDFIPKWLEEASLEAETQKYPLESVSSHHRPNHEQPQFHRRWKLHVQFAIISSDYHLGILNDIHVRSPGQSFLKALDRWSLSSFNKNVSSPYYSGLQLESSWIYLYGTIAYIRRSASSLTFENIDQDMDKDSDSEFDLSSFTASCYQRGQELIPVLQNLRGVVDNAEFFQRDNYRVLVQARRCLVSGMEHLYQQQPSLSAVHKVLSPLTSSHDVPRQVLCTQQRDGDFVKNRDGIPLDVVLEGALLSLGRCLDLVRPAGLLTGSVPAHDFKLALMILDQAVAQISIACDPDQPLNFTSSCSDNSITSI